MIEKTAKGRTILFVGAGEYQRPGILKARDMGCKVVAIDGNPSAPGFADCDFSYPVDVADIPGALAVARKHHVDGVLAICAEIAVPTVAALAESLDLPGIRPDAAAIATDKFKMREVFRGAGLPSPRYGLVRNRDELKDISRDVGFPCVIKPVDDSGSRGVRRVENMDELVPALSEALRHSRSGKAILEEFIQGTECTIEALTDSGRTEILAVSDKIKRDGAYRVATDLVYPPDLPEETIGRIRQTVQTAVKAMGMTTGTTHSELIVTGGGEPVMLEVAARGGGYKVFSDVIRLVSGVDAVEQCVRMALGLKVDIAAKKRDSACLHFFAPPPGRLVDVKGWDTMKDLDGVEAGLFVPVGGRIPELANDRSRTGYALAWGKTRAAVLEKIRLLEESIEFVVEPLPQVSKGSGA